MGLSPFEIAVALVVTALAAAAQGVVGIGFAVVSVPVLALVDSRLAPVPQLLVALPLTLLMGWRERRHADLRGVVWILVGRGPGALTGLALLAIAEARALDLIIALVVLAGVAIRGSGMTIRRTRPRQFLVGVLAGTTSMVASMGGPPVALLYQDERAATIRASLSMVFTLGVLITIGGRAATGRIDGEDVAIATVLLPAMLAGFAASVPLTRRIDERVVRVGILTVSTVAAVGLLVRAR